MELFDAAFAIVVGEEGGYVGDPADPGGETKFGISRRAYPSLDIAALTLDQAKAIYRRDYWDNHRCGEMPWRWALAVFDAAINQGEGVRWAQLALSAVEDGVAGAQTLTLMATAPDDDYRAFLALRAESYVRQSGFAAYGHGWLKRLFHIAAAAEHPPT
jgi:lysozyme family protein